MTAGVVNLKQKLSSFSERWSPRVVAEMNDYQFKLVKLQGEFVWHRHEETDEVFMVVMGEMQVGFRDGDVTIREGEMIVVPRGVEHRTVAEEEAEVVLFEPAATRNTGNVEDDRLTAPAGVRV